MDLFEININQSNSTNLPLAEKIRPTKLEDFFGQDHIVGPKSVLRDLIENQNFLPNLIIWGPPGSGKTTLSRLLAKKMKCYFLEVSAVDTGAKQLREIGEESKNKFKFSGTQSIIFIDEIHRLNKSQQDVLLPYTEKRDFILIGATTENPSYEINSALLSRSKLIVLKAHTSESLRKVLNQAANFVNIKTEEILTQEGLNYLINVSDGDARRMIGVFEQIVSKYQIENLSSSDEKLFPLEPADIKSFGSDFYLPYDSSGEEHHNCISAFIKSIRGSDPQAGVYYLSRMLESGEDPKFIARRLIVLASEDIGNADPRALSIAISGAQAVEFVGLPEAAINLAQVVTYMACAPKSNRSYLALKSAQNVIKETGHLPIPISLRSANDKVSKSLGYGKDYNYSHDGDRGYIPQQFLPDKIKGKIFYEPTNRGFEKTLNDYQNWLGRKINKNGDSN